MGISKHQNKQDSFGIVLKEFNENFSFLKQIFTKLPNAIGIFDKDGRYIASNREYIELFKVIPPEDYSRLTDPHLKKDITEKATRMLKNNQNFQFPVMWYNTKNINSKYPDNEVFIETTAIPLVDKDDQLKYIVMIFQDKTELEKEKTTLKNIIELNPYSIEIKNKEGYQVMCNQSFIDLWGGPNPDDYCIFDVPELKENGILDNFRKILEGNVVKFPEAYYNPHDTREDLPNRPIWHKAVGFPIFNRHGEVEQAVIMHEDITKRKIAEQKLEELKNKLENRIKERTILLENSEKKYRKAYKRANCYKGLFTHDVSNIIQVVSNSLEYLRMKYFDSMENEDKDLFTAMEKHLKRGKNLVHNIQNLSEIEGSEVPLTPTGISFHLEKAIDFVKANFLKRDINVNIKGFTEDLYVMANELLLDVFENILINAVRYNENENVEIKIRASQLEEDERNFIQIEFIDNGIGIEDKYKELIFQEEFNNKKFTKGMGLGLSLVSKIVELCHGKIWVENRVINDYSKGSNFIIQFPKAKKDNAN